MAKLLLLQFLLTFLEASGQIYHNQIAVKVSGGEKVVKELASRHGLELIGKIGDLDDHYLLHSPHIRKRFFPATALKHFNS